MESNMEDMSLIETINLCRNIRIKNSFKNHVISKCRYIYKKTVIKNVTHQSPKNKIDSYMMHKAVRGYKINQRIVSFHFIIVVPVEPTFV